MAQITLDRKKGTATISLSQFFYPLHLLQQAAAQFSGIAKISVSAEGERAIVAVMPLGKTKAEDALLHFCNFALSLKRELGEHA